MRLRGLNVVVSGASRGLGAAVTEALVREGASLYLGARGEAELAATAQRLKPLLAPGASLFWAPMDLSSKPSVEAFAAKVCEAFPVLDVLVNNAGITGPLGPLDKTGLEDWEASVEVNLFGPLRLTRSLLPALRRARRGKVINLSGGAATQGVFGHSAYGAAKAALVRVTEILAMEDQGLDVNAVAPGAMNTAMLDDVLAAGPENIGAEYHHVTLERKRKGGAPPAVAAGLIAWLSSPESDGVTGRLLSAHWDPWKELPAKLDDLRHSDIYQLRRIIPEDRGFHWPLQRERTTNGLKVVVQGLWHLGCVSAAGTASVGHQVVALAEDEAEAARLRALHLPVHEPGLDALFREGLEQGRLSVTTDPAEALAGAQVCWICYDTPVDSQDRADGAFVMARAAASLRHMRAGQVLLISSQLPVGSVARLKEQAPAGVGIACSPENLRLGSALNIFMEPDRIVLGADDDASRAVLKRLFEPISPRLEWMSAASAEMTKHAINAFLASSVVFINEIASLCESHGADAGEVARGLKSESRIGPKAYLGPGAAFAGGTLARDLQFLSAMATAEGQPRNLFNAALESNRRHGQWPLKALERALSGGLKGKRIAVLGLAYKVDTDTLRRSPAVELLEALHAQGAVLRAADPLVKALEGSLAGIKVSAEAAPALADAEALVLFHPWPGLDQAYAALAVKPAIVDPQGQFPGGPPPACPSYSKVGVLGAAA